VNDVAGFSWDTDNPLHRAAGESARANVALRDYFRMGAGRSLRSLLERYLVQGTSKEQTEKPPTLHWSTLCGWSAKFDWQKRVEAQTAIEAAEDEATWRERRREAIERDWQVAGKLLKLSDQILEQGPKFLKATTRVIKQGRPALRDTEGRLIDPGEAEERLTVVALDAGLAVKAAATGSDLARKAAGLDVQKHEVNTTGMILLGWDEDDDSGKSGDSAKTEDTVQAPSEAA